MHTTKKDLGFPRPYLRDGVPGLPIERQREMLQAAGVDISDERMLFVDRLTDAAIKRRDPVALKQRAVVLNPLHEGETIYIAGLRVLGWTMSDIARSLLAAAKRQANVHCVDTGVTYSADMPGSELLEALAGAEEAHRRGTAQEKQHRAVTAARAAKNRRTAVKVLRAEPLWRDRNYTVDQIAAEVGLSRRTLYNALGPRWEDVQHA
jgi:AraC-like DNA-binding protein